MKIEKQIRIFEAIYLLLCFVLGVAIVFYLEFPYNVFIGALFLNIVIVMTVSSILYQKRLFLIFNSIKGGSE